MSERRAGGCLSSRRPGPNPNNPTHPMNPAMAPKMTGPEPWDNEPEVEVEINAAPKMADVCVPSSAVAIADGDQTTEPEVGDQVAVTLEGKVSRVEGGHIYFTPDTANGEPMSAPKSEDQELEQEGAELRGLLANA